MRCSSPTSSLYITIIDLEPSNDEDESRGFVPLLNKSVRIGKKNGTIETYY
jgi:hypothetical protein